ncbi:uncharacterized protein cubi_00502 [Cryptosporidium ubiquitum]|uniref:Uncharacterized protein n=1 Tax=Cryptosporidium ubiquitum TaxID=857276 RepID=A0A1J4MGC2_9CRYT|nr:uncharacterized protein cubi_00502 [Cryptosporidium ubiquitum]OII72507.1 hypothetical protein cubi_00502 [Cryptosporidium ubiquitum]
MTGVYEKQCRGARFDYMVSTVENCKSLLESKNYKESYSLICELLLSLCNDRELIEEFFYSGAFEFCCEFLKIKGENDLKIMNNDSSEVQDVEIPNLIIEQLSLLSSFTLQSFDEEIGEISMLIFFLTERHRYYVDVNWKSNELKYMGIFLQSHFRFLYSAIKSFNKFEKTEGPSILLLTLKNIEVAIRGFPAHRIVPNMVKALTENSTWEIIAFVAEIIISNTLELLLEQKEKSENNNTNILMQFRECALVLVQIITYFPTIGTSPGINKHIIPSLIQIGFQKLFLTQSNNMVSIRCSCRYCENCRKIQKICTKREELIIKESVPLLKELIDVFMKNNALDMLSNLITTIQNIDNNCTMDITSSNNYFSYQKAFINMIPFIQKMFDTEHLNKTIVTLMQIMPKSTKISTENTQLTTLESNRTCFAKITISKTGSEISNSNSDEKCSNIKSIEIVTLTEQTKNIISCLTGIILQSFDFPIKSNENMKVSGILEIVCPTFELLLRKCIIEWEKQIDYIINNKFTNEQMILILSEINTLLNLIVPIYLKYLRQKNINSNNKNTYKSTFQFLQKALSNILSVFSECFLSLSQIFITESNSEKPSKDHSKTTNYNQISQEQKDTIYFIGSSLILSLSIISDVSTYNWTNVSRRRYLPSPHFKVCGWISSSQFKFVDLWKRIFMSERCIIIKELSQIVTLISERSSALNSKDIITRSLKFSSEDNDQYDAFLEDTDDEAFNDSLENMNLNLNNVE